MIVTRSARWALRELAGAQKSRRGVSLYSRWVNRPLGRLLAAAAYRVGLSPNGVSVLSAIVSGAGILVVALVEPAPWVGALAAVLLVLGFALDSADGQVARLTGRGSKAGEWLDHVLDAGKMVLVHGAVAVSALLHLDTGRLVVLVPILFQLVSIVVFVGGLLHVQLSESRPTSASRPSTVRSVLLLPADYGILAVSFVLLGWPVVFGVAYVLLLIANAVIGSALLAKWFRDLR